MAKTWIELHIALSAEMIDLAIAELAEFGCEGVTVLEKALDTFVAPDPEEEEQGILTVRAYFPEQGAPAVLVDQVRERLNWLAQILTDAWVGEIRAERIGAQDWAQDWKQHFGTQRIGRRLVVAPTWEEPELLAGDALVRLDPGMAFGTGTHGTTRLCLEALDGCFAGEAEPRRVLDVGTGSGILAIAAAALGAEEVLACDIEPESCQVAAENARLNKVADRIEITAAGLETLSGFFDVVLANILAEENVRLAAELVKRLAPGGVLILSGILREKEEIVRAGFAGFALKGPQVDRLEDWSCLTYRRSR